MSYIYIDMLIISTLPGAISILPADRHRGRHSALKPVQRRLSARERNHDCKTE